MVSVCVSVTALAASASVYVRKQRVSRRLLLDFDSWIFEKNFCSKVMARKRQYAIREPFSRSFWTNETQHLREGQLVGRILLQRLATGATGVKQARYR